MRGQINEAFLTNTAGILEQTRQFDNALIYASKYELYLPDKKELQEKLGEWIAEETGGEKS